MREALASTLLAFDVVLAALLTVLALAVLFSRDLFRAIVLFIAFGLLVSLTWCRLGALDIALAEAAIGAGITGALFLGLHSDLAARAQHVESTASAVSRSLSVLQAVLAAGMGVLLLEAILFGPSTTSSVAPLALAALDQSGVSHPVTAVLLSYRAYDTLLEIFVVTIAVAAAFSQRLRPPHLAVEPAPSVLAAAARAVLPVAVLSAGYYLWLGSHAPGGAFQAGAVLAGALVLSLLVGHVPGPMPRILVRLGLSLGVLVFALVGLGYLVSAAGFLGYRGASASVAIAGIEAAATISIALGLTGLFVGHEPQKERRE
jgi:multisubunit Na+/H+ antiporter MnhB subunit